MIWTSEKRFEVATKSNSYCNRKENDLWRNSDPINQTRVRLYLKVIYFKMDDIRDWCWSSTAGSNMSAEQDVGPMQQRLTSSKDYRRTEPLAAHAQHLSVAHFSFLWLESERSYRLTDRRKRESLQDVWPVCAVVNHSILIPILKPDFLHNHFMLMIFLFD